MEIINFIGNNENLLESLSNLEKKTEAFQIRKGNLEKKLLNNSEIIILDDCYHLFHKSIIKYDLKNYKYCIYLLKRKNKVDILNNKKVLYKPFRIFDLHKEIVFKINLKKKNIKNWKLDNTKLSIISPDETEIKLTDIELQLLRILFKNKFKSITKEYLLKHVWKINCSKINIEENRVLETTISRIRKKLNSYPSSPKIKKEKKGYLVSF